MNDLKPLCYHDRRSILMTVELKSSPGPSIY